ncbi:C component of insecticidal toxin complex [Yersinia pseudotuberculosis]|nr:C component of insecticidal toxin complex [Yersinia pseudotuberculosis]
MREETTGIILVMGDTLTSVIRRVGMAMVRDAAHGQPTVVEDRDRRGFTE